MGLGVVAGIIAAGAIISILTVMLTVMLGMRFGVWLVIGLAIYFTHSRRHSLLNPASPRHANAEASARAAGA